MSTVLLIALLIIVWFTIKSTGNRSKSRSPNGNTKTVSAPPLPVAAYAWPALDEYDFEVVGESNYQHILSALSETANPNDEKTGLAILVPEDTNPYDNKAVKVTMQGLTIGYLSREDARSYRRRLATKKLGMVAASCGVLITGGHMLKDGTRAHFGAQLDMKPFD
jgi:hypothetical protein